MHDRGVVTQADMAAETGLQPSTIFRIFRALEAEGVILQVEGEGPSEPRQGRRPGYYELNPRTAFSLGVYLSHSEAAILLVDFKGDPIQEHSIELPDGTSARDVLEHLLQAIGHVMDRANVDHESLLGIGIGAPGVIDIDRGEVVMYPRLSGMEGLPVRRKLQDRFGAPVFIHNNASVIALAENRFGRAAGHDSVVAFLIRSGVGGAFVKNGELYTSQGMTAFEIGHMTLNVGPDESGCSDQTLEDILSETALITRAREADPSISSLDDLAASMDSEQNPACRALESVAGAFVEKARNIALMLNPEAFIIVARRLPIAEYFATRFSRILAHDGASRRFNVSTVIPLEYDPILACRGAADLVFDDFFGGSGE